MLESSRFIHFASLFAVTAWVLSRLSGCLNRVVFFDGAFADGPFQLFNSLRRLAAGQVAGQDFPVFHGIGLPWLHYPLFRLFGEGLFGSEMSRQLTSTVLCTAGMLLMLRCGAGTWRRTVLWFALFLILLQVPAQLFGAFSDPGVSMTDLRGLAPLLGAVIFATAPARWLRMTSLALCLGVVPVLGVDQAPPFFLAVIIVAGALFLRHLRSRTSDSIGLLRELVAAVGCGLVMAAGLMLLISGQSGTIKALKFNFVETAADEFWFFGVPANSLDTTNVDYFKSATDILTHWYSWPLAVWLASAVVAVVTLVRGAGLSVRQTGCAIVLCYGFLSTVPSLGFLGNSYLKDGTNAMLLVLFLTRWEAFAAWLLRHRMPVRVMGLALMVFAVFQSALAAQKIQKLVHAPDLRSVHFSQRWQDILSSGEDLLHRYRSRGKHALWSTYSGELGSRTGEFLPAEDYMIHALGPERRTHYLAAFQAAAPAVVMTSDFWSEHWLQNETWGLYEELLTNYSFVRRVGGSTDGVVYWVRNEAGQVAVATTPGQARLLDESHFVVEGAGGGTSGTAQKRLGTVSIQYQLRYSSAFEQALSKMARYLIKGDSAARPVPVSLPPYKTKWSFPVVSSGEPLKFSASTSGILAYGHVSITQVAVEWWPEDSPLAVFDATAVRGDPNSPLP